MRKLSKTALALIFISPISAHAGFFGDAMVNTGQALVNAGSPKSGEPANIAAVAPSAKPPEPKCDAAQEGSNRKDAEQREAEVSVKKHVNTTCLERFQHFSMGGKLGYPDPWQLLQSAINQVCSAADMKVNGALAPANQGIPLPGGLGRVDSSVSANGNNPAAPAPTPGTWTSGVGTNGTSTTNGGMPAPGGTNYPVPPLWR